MTNFITDDLINANVRSKWYSGTSTTTGASGTPIDFDTEHTGMVAVGNWVNDGAGTITIPANGTYRFTVNIAASTNINVFTAINIYKNAAASGVVAKGTSTGNNSQVWNGTISLDCEKDDEIYISHNDPGGFDFDNSINETYFEIQRIADYSAGEPAGFGLATATKAGLVKAPKFAIHQLQGLTQTTGILTDLTFQNLVIGQPYRLTLSLSYQFLTTGSASIRAEWATGGTTLIKQMTIGYGSNAAISEGVQTIIKDVVATSTQINFDAYAGWNSNIRLLGDPTDGVQATYAMLEQLPSNAIATTEWD